MPTLGPPTPVSAKWECSARWRVRGGTGSKTGKGGGGGGGGSKMAGRGGGGGGGGWVQGATVKLGYRKHLPSLVIGPWLGSV